MQRKEWLLIFTLLLPLLAFGQGQLLWQDTFSDDDVKLQKQVAWQYYSAADGLVGSIVEQRSGAMFLQTGSYSGMLAAVLSETNGLPEIRYTDSGKLTDSTKMAVKKNYYSYPNQSIVFQINFKKITGSFFVLSTRMTFDSDSLDSDPTESPGYALFISPLQGTMMLGKYQGDLAILNPTTWTPLAQGKYAFTLDANYWVRVYLNGGDMKAKLWEGEVTDEPADWNMEGMDPDPRVEGTFTLFGLLNPSNANAKDQVIIDNVSVYKEGDILWEDTFNDNDTPVHENVGWNYYNERDGVTGTIVEQRNGGLFMQTGSYSGMLGVVLAETNGVSALAFDAKGNPTDATKAAIKKDDYSNPNQVITFQVNFKKLTSSFFLCSTRMTFDSDSLDSDPTESPGYALFISPLQGQLLIGKYSGDLAILNPPGYTPFAQGKFAFALDVPYWVKFYLNEGDVKAKIWEGEASDEPTDWLMEGKDPSPRVSGTFTLFGLMSPTNANAKDQMVLDNITVSKPEGTGTKVERLVSSSQPSQFVLHPNFPNPFNAGTEIRYDLANDSEVQLVVYNAIGQRVAELVNARQQAGNYRVIWNGQSSEGQILPSGLYLCRMKTAERSQTIKLILSK
jgi:hypothetical protein